MVSSDCVICPRSRRTLCCLPCTHTAILESGRRKPGPISEEGTALTAKRTEHVSTGETQRKEVVIGAMDVSFRNVAAHAEQSASGVTHPVEELDAYLAIRASDMSTMSQDRHEYMMSNDPIRGIYGSAVDACTQLLANYLRQVVEVDRFRTVAAAFVARAANPLAEGIRLDDLHRAGARTAASRTTLVHHVLAALKTTRWPSAETVLSMLERRTTWDRRNSRTPDLTYPESALKVPNSVRKRRSGNAGRPPSKSERRGAFAEPHHACRVNAPRRSDFDDCPLQLHLRPRGGTRPTHGQHGDANGLGHLKSWIADGKSVSNDLCYAVPSL